MRRTAPMSILSVCVTALLFSCAAEPSRFQGPAAEYGRNRERQVFFALTEVKADDQQRATILAAFDVADPKLKALSEEVSSAQQKLMTLDARQPDYLDLVEPLAKRRGEIDAEKLLLKARFDQAVAAALKPAQWQQWVALFDRPPGRDGDGGDSDRPSGSRSRGGRQRGA